MPYRAIARALAGPLILLLIVVGFFWKLVLTDQYTWLESPDLASQVVPWFQFEAQQFHEHHFPSWDPHLFAGQSLIGQAQPGLAYPLNWILFSLPLDHGHISFTALNWYYLLIHYLAALFCYFLCRDLGRSEVASVAAGVAFGLGGYIGTTDWPQMINGAIWAPLVFLFLLRTTRGIRPVASAALSGLFLGLSWLSGHHQIPIFLTLAAVAIWLYFLLGHRRIQRKLLAPIVVFLAFVIFTSALQTWPAWSYGHTALRWAGANETLHWNDPVPYTVETRYSLDAIHLLGIVIPGYAAGANPYTGIVALALAALALACAWKTGYVRLFFALGIGGLLLALAKNDILHGILYSLVPMFEKARSPAVALCLFHFAIAVLAAFGLDVLMSQAPRLLVRRAAMVLAVFGALTCFIAFAVKMSLALNWNSDDRVMIPTLAACALAGLFYRVSRMDTIHHAVPALIIALFIVELGNVSLYTLPNKAEKNRNVYLSHYQSTAAAAQFLKKQPGPIRVDVNGEDVPFNFGDWFGIDTLSGYTASIPEAFVDAETHTPRVKLLLGANYALSKKSTLDGQEELFRDDDGLSVFKNPGAFPRVWVVHEAAQVRDVKEARRNFQDPSFDLSKKTFGYTRPPSLEPCDGDTVSSFTRDTDRTTAIVDMRCRGMVVMSEADASGWTASIDGRPAPIYPAYTLLRGVVVNAGRHRIETRYHPLSVTAGWIATLSAFATALLLCALPRLKRRED